MDKQTNSMTSTVQPSGKYHLGSQDQLSIASNLGLSAR